MTADLCSTDVFHFVGSEGNRLTTTVYRGPQSRLNQERMVPPILFMHGGGQTRHSWDGAARQLAGLGYTAVAADARGHGDSEWVGSKNYNFEHYSLDLRHLAEQVDESFGNGNHPCILVGASMGGVSAMLAQVHGGAQEGTNLFSAIILVDITPRMAGSGVERILGFMSQDMRKGFSDPAEAADAIAAYLPGRKRPKSLDGLRKNLRQRDDGRWYWHWDPAFIDGENNITSGRENRIEELYAAVKKISVPTLLIRGSKSELVTQEAADEFLELVPHAKYVDVTDAGHMVAGDKNDVFADAVMEFLADTNKN